MRMLLSCLDGHLDLRMGLARRSIHEDLPKGCFDEGIFILWYGELRLFDKGYSKEESLGSMILHKQSANYSNIFQYHADAANPPSSPSYG